MAEEQQIAELEALAAGAEECEQEYIPSGDPEPPPGPSSAELCEQLLALSFAVAAARLGEHWRLSPEEAAEGGKAYGALLDKYLPGAELGVEATAVVVTGMIVLPRLLVEPPEPAAADEKEEPTEPTEPVVFATPDERPRDGS